MKPKTLSALLAALATGIINSSSCSRPSTPPSEKTTTQLTQTAVYSSKEIRDLREQIPKKPTFPTSLPYKPIEIDSWEYFFTGQPTLTRQQGPSIDYIIYSSNASTVIRGTFNYDKYIKTQDAADITFNLDFVEINSIRQELDSKEREKWEKRLYDIRDEIGIFRHGPPCIRP